MGSGGVWRGGDSTEGRRENVGTGTPGERHAGRASPREDMARQVLFIFFPNREGQVRILRE